MACRITRRRPLTPPRAGRSRPDPPRSGGGRPVHDCQRSGALLHAGHDRRLADAGERRADAHAAEATNGEYGFGNFLFTLEDGTPVVWHDGIGVGQRSIFFLLPQTGDGLIILTNKAMATASSTRSSARGMLAAQRPDQTLPDLLIRRRQMHHVELERQPPGGITVSERKTALLKELDDARAYLE